MKNKTLQALLLTCLVTVLGGCAGGNEKNVLVRIDKKHIITLASFNNRISKLPQRYRDVINKNKAAFLNEVIIDELLYNEALNKGLNKDKEIKEIMREARKKILIARLLKDEVDDEIVISEEEIQEFYNANGERFGVPEVRRASHILVATDEEAQNVLQELAAGKKFEDLARERSIDPTSKVGGDIGYFTRKQLTPEIETVAFGMEVDEISGVVKTKFGYHLIKLTEIRDPRVKELAEVRDAVEQSLRRIKKRARFNNFATKLKEKSTIYINDKLLKDISESRTPGAKPEN